MNIKALLIRAEMEWFETKAINNCFVLQISLWLCISICIVFTQHTTIYIEFNAKTQTNILLCAE